MDYKRCTGKRKSLHMIYIKNKKAPFFIPTYLLISLFTKFPSGFFNIFFKYSLIYDHYFLKNYTCNSEPNQQAMLKKTDESSIEYLDCWILTTRNVRYVSSFRLTCSPVKQVLLSKIHFILDNTG